MIRRIFSLGIVIVALLMEIPSSFAMTFVDAETVMSARLDYQNQRIRGETFMRVKDVDGTELVFTVHDAGSFHKNCVSMESADRKTVYYTFPAGNSVEVKEIHTENHERNFWVVETRTGAGCRSFCLIGRYGDVYVAYVTLDDLRAAGLIGREVRWDVDENKIVVQGGTDNHGEELARKGEMYSQLDEVKLFWDEDAQWMGIRRESGTPFVDVEDTWFYTDEEGAEYYLRQTNMARSWIGGYVFKVDTDGETSCLLYRFEDFPNCPYSIYDGGDFVHPGPKIEKGLLYVGGGANPSAVALYEKYLYQEKAEAVARRRAAEERHRRESGAEE